MELVSESTLRVMRALFSFSLLVLALSASAQISGLNPREFKIERGAVDSDGFPTSSAKFCFVNDPADQCYLPPKHDPPFGLEPTAKLIRLATGEVWVLFTAVSSAGGSGWATHVAFIRAANGKAENVLPDITLSNQSEYQLWELPAGPFPVFATADFLLGKGESHFARHRYKVRVYKFRPDSMSYFQCDEFVTTRKYPGLDDADSVRVLEAEKANILSRLK